MTNPNNAVGTNAAYGGRTSVNAFNDDLTIYSRGILSGWACSPNSGMTVQIGGNGSDRDAAVAEDNAGNKTSINNISGSPIDVTIPAAPATNNRIDLIVAYADNPPSGTSTVVDNPAACGIIVVSGTAASSPTAPTNATIRSAITADGASGSTAYYVILAQIRVGTGVTTIGSGVITQGAKVESGARAGASTVSTNSIADGAVTSDKIDWTTLAPYWKTVATSTSASVSIPLSYRQYRIRLFGYKSSTNSWGVLQCPQATGTTWIYIQGMSGGTWIAAERSVTASSDKAVMDGARSATSAGYQSWDITIDKPTSSSTAMYAMWQTTTQGSITYNTGRSSFTLSSGSGNMTLTSELSTNAKWVVEALVES